MPLPLRKVEPTYVCRGTLPDKVSVPNDLEAVANGTLSNVILQLSSLSHHAGEMFTDLVRVTTDISTRSASLQARLDRLAVKVNQLDGTQEECSMQDCLNTKPFQSSTAFDQQVVSRPTIAAGMAHRYSQCDRPPPLEKLNSYRDDGKDGLKFYTDPNYFFDLWRHEMLKDTDKAVKKPHKPKGEGGQRHKKRVRQPVNTREKQKNMAIQHGEHFVDSSQMVSKAATQGVKPMEVGDGVIYPPEMPKKSSRPNSMEIKRVSFEGVDNVDDKGSSQDRGLGSDTLSSSLESPPAFDPNEIRHTRDRIISRSNSHACHNANGMTLPRKFSSGGYPPLTNGRRSSDSSENSVKINGYVRPTQPPPAPPPASISPCPINTSSGGAPNGKAVRGYRDARESLPPPPPPPEAEVASNGPQRSSTNYPLPPASMMDGRQSGILPPPLMEDNEDDLPPPPPTPDQIRASHVSADMPPAPPNLLRSSMDEILPPAPPPPQSESPVPPPPPPPLMSESPSPTKVIETTITTSVVKEKKVIAPVVDTRSELLQAIRGGISLKKVEVKTTGGKEDKVSTTYGDVTSILRRRVAMEMSDSDSSSSEYDSDGWDETSA